MWDNALESPEMNLYKNKKFFSLPQFLCISNTIEEGLPFSIPPPISGPPKSALRGNFQLSIKKIRLRMLQNVFLSSEIKRTHPN